MSDQVVEFFTEKEWYDQDEISMNKRLAVREFDEWLQSRPIPLTPVIVGAEIVAKNEILNMAAGKDLDVLIEQRIFHHEVFTKDKPRKTSNVNKKNDVIIFEKELWAVLTKYSSVPVRSYSTSISSAWEVVKEVLGFDNSNDFELRTTVRGWKCIFSDSHAEYSASGETAPEAICRAALLTVYRKV